MDLQEEKKQKQRSKLKKTYPDFNYLVYDLSLRQNLFYYNLEEDYDFKKAHALLFWEKQGKDVKKIAKLDKGYFCTAGALAHMIVAREIELDERAHHWLSEKYLQLSSLYVEEEKPQVVQVKREAPDNTPEIICALEDAVDNIRKTDFDARKFLLSSNLKPIQLNKISKWFKRHLDEVKDIPNDPQLIEAYSHYGKRELKKLESILTEIVDGASNISKTTKVKVVRKRKEKPASVLVKSVVLTKEYSPLKLKTLPAEKIVGADEAWFFDTKSRRLIKYASQVGCKLTVKGKSIMNFDPDKSGSKILRKPEEQLSGCTTWTKRPANTAMNEIKAVFTGVSGRISETMILIGVY